MPTSSEAPLSITCGFYNFFIQPKLLVRLTRLNVDCMVMETQSAAVKFLTISTLVYFDTISTHQVGKFYFSWHLRLYTFRLFLAFFSNYNDNSSFPGKAWIIISTSVHGNIHLIRFKLKRIVLCNISYNSAWSASILK